MVFNTRTGESVKSHNNLTKKALKTDLLMNIIETEEYINSQVVEDEAQFFPDLEEFVLYSEKHKSNYYNEIGLGDSLKAIRTNFTMYTSF